MNTKWWDFSPRLGLAWDVKGDGRTSLRISGGSFYDYPSNLYLQAFSNGAPFLPIFVRTAVNLDNPWNNPTDKNVDPFPLRYGSALQYNDAIWPLNALVTTTDYNTPTMQIYSWNLSLQKQVGSDWLVAATYLGNSTSHMWVQRGANPGVFLGLNPCTINGVNYSTCSTTANLPQRRVLSLTDPAKGQYYGAINQVDAGGTASYNGMILNVQRRAGKGVTVAANYTWAHCITDPGGLSAIQGTSDVGDRIPTAAGSTGVIVPLPRPIAGRRSTCRRLHGRRSSQTPRCGPSPPAGSSPRSFAFWPAMA